MDDAEFFPDVAVSGYTPTSNKTLPVSLFPPTLGIIRLLNFCPSVECKVVVNYHFDLNLPSYKESWTSLHCLLFDSQIPVHVFCPFFYRWFILSLFIFRRFFFNIYSLSVSRVCYKPLLPVLQLTSFYFFHDVSFFGPVLLRYNWYPALYKFKVYSMIWFTYIMKLITTISLGNFHHLA